MKAKFPKNIVREARRNWRDWLKKDTTQVMDFAQPVEEKLDHVVIWTDGGCWKNPGGAGAWAAVLRFGDHRKEIHAPVAAPTTNNQCELLAVIEALESLKRRVKVTLYTDSKYVQAVMNPGAKKTHKFKNQDLVVRARGLARQHDVTVHWVKGHAGNSENERCDALCNSYRIPDTFFQRKAADNRHLRDLDRAFELQSSQ